jgi:hypothetical protein
MELNALSGLVLVVVGDDVVPVPVPVSVVPVPVFP